MKIRVDEHISPRIVAEVKNKSLSPGWELTSIYDVDEGGVSDVHWVTSFRLSGGDAIISADADFHKKPPQIEAISRTGLKVICLPGKFGQAKIDVQIDYILTWWHSIESTLRKMGSGEYYKTFWKTKKPLNLKKMQIRIAEDIV
ncbi:MAG: hypothetical protein OXL41_05110 [Nitrospinae bacterium]|nr:hypothetical protein [Nitrospinota bacterium]